MLVPLEILVAAMFDFEDCKKDGVQTAPASDF
jgi:hypothetical protein